ncbi:MAG: hypothetical protein LBI13_04035 [Streptococcaceae bacterium]|jgi:transposase|nr:hypothetical protein [Streptococcaceae bacterium]
METQKTYKPFDDLLRGTGFRYDVIAERAGLSVQTLYGWRTRPNKIPTDGMLSLARATGLDFSKMAEVAAKAK